MIREPEVVERRCELDPELDLVVGEPPPESCAKVALLRNGDIEPLLTRRVEGEVRGDGECEEVLGMPLLDRVEVTRRTKPVGRVLPDRLEQSSNARPCVERGSCQ